MLSTRSQRAPGLVPVGPLPFPPGGPGAHCSRELGNAARSTRRLLPAALFPSRVLVGILGQAAFHGTLVLLQGARFPNAPVGTIVPSGPWVISLSVLAGGFLFAILDRSLDRWPEARHMIERP